MKAKKANIKPLFISIGFSICCLLAAQFFFAPLSAHMLQSKLAFPLLRLMFFIFIGLLAGQVIENAGWTRQVAIIARPFFRFSNLGERCSSAFTTAFISGAAANAMLLDFYEEKKITKMQLFLSNYVNQFPAFFLHLPTTAFIILPLTGTAGLLYLIITFLATVVRTVSFFVFGRVALTEHGTYGKKEPRIPENVSHGFREIFNQVKSRLPARLTNIAVWVLPIYTGVFLLNTNGFFQYLNQSVSRMVALKLMPVESLGVVILSFAAEFTSGFAAAGALMDAGVLSVKQTVIALLLGNILAFPIRALRHQLPRYMGIFSPKMGLQLLLSGQLFRVVSIIFVGTLYYMVA